MTAPTSRTPSAVSAVLRDAYGSGAAAWADGPVRMYRALADVLVAQAPDAVHGGRVLDLGAGTGAASAAAFAVGARAVIAIDVADGMLRHDQTTRPPAVVGDGVALPLRSAGFDAVIAACCVNHAPDPAGMLAEARRVTRPGGAVLASTFAEGRDHLAKALVDGALAGFGFVAPGWYVELKTGIMPRTATTEALVTLARAAGFASVDVRALDVDTGLRTAEELASWRTGMAPQAAFLAGLPDAVRREAVAAAVEAVGADPEPLEAHLLALVARR